MNRPFRWSKEERGPGHRHRGRFSVWSALLAAGLAPAIGCAPSQGARVAADVAVIREEQTSDKLLERGRAFAAVGDYTRAEQYLSSAIEAGSDPKVVLPFLLKVCVSEQRYWVAIAYAEPHLRRNPEDYRLRFVVASLYSNIGDTKVALDHLEQVVALKPDHADAHYALAVLFRDDEQDLPKADAHFREYLRVLPKGPHAAEARGSLLKTVPAPPSGPTSGSPARPRGDAQPEPGSGAAEAGGGAGTMPVRLPSAAASEPASPAEPARPAAKNPPDSRASKPR